MNSEKIHTRNDVKDIKLELVQRGEDDQLFKIKKKAIGDNPSAVTFTL